MTTGWQRAAENPTDVPVLDWNQTVLVMSVVLVSVLAAGLLVILGRRLAPHKDPRAGSGAELDRHFSGAGASGVLRRLVGDRRLHSAEHAGRRPRRRRRSRDRVLLL